MANQFGFMMKEEFLQAYADYLKQLREQNPGKRYAVMLSLDLIPDGVGYEISSPQLTVNEVTEDGKSTILEMTGPSQITINEVNEDDRPSFLSPAAIERICREAYAHFTTVYGKRKAGTWEELPEKERTLVLDITGYVARTLYRKEQGGQAKPIADPSTEYSEERDIHFAGFAKLLWDELVRANEYHYIDVNTDDDGIDPTNYRLVIARRAYDLAQHVRDDIRSCAYSLTFPSIDDIPDLTEWPVGPDEPSEGNPA